MCSCLCACVRARACVHVCARMLVRACACACVRACVRASVCICVCLNVHARACRCVCACVQDGLLVSNAETIRILCEMTKCRENDVHWMSDRLMPHVRCVRLARRGARVRVRLRALVSAKRARVHRRSARVCLRRELSTAGKLAGAMAADATPGAMVVITGLTGTHSRARAQ